MQVPIYLKISKYTRPPSRALASGIKSRLAQSPQSPHLCN